MFRLATFSVRRPVAALVAWLAVAVALTAVGFGITNQLSPKVTTIAGTEAQRAEDLSAQQFGPSVLVPILLQGPKAQVDRQGPILVKRLAARPDTRVMSAWDAGATGRSLRPSPTSAMIVASVAHTEKAMVDTYQRQIQGVVDGSVGGPVHAHVSGQPTIDLALRDAAIDDARTVQLIALPILFVLLLLILRRPLAALGVTVFGGVGFLASNGALAILARFVDIEASAVVMSSVAGLAVSVGLALMMVERFLEEEASTRAGDRFGSAMAAARTVATAGRSVLVGGTAFVAAAILATLIGPTEVMISIGAGVVACATLGIGAAVVVVPAALVLLGHRLDAGRFQYPGPFRRGWARLVAAAPAALRHPVAMGALATAFLLALAIPLTSFSSGPADVAQLPKDAKARQDFEAIAGTMGPGWPTPFNVIVVSRTKPITTASMLKQLDRYQAQVARDDRVASVVGPGALSAQTKDLAKLPKSLRDSSKLLVNGKRDLGRLAGGLDQAGAGARELQSGLSDAASGASKLHSGSGAAGSGASQLKAGLAAAEDGARKISGGLTASLTGARALREGAAKALAGSKQLTGGLNQAGTPVKAGAPVVKQMAADLSASTAALGTLDGSAKAATGQIDQALAALRASGASGAQYDAAVAALTAARDRAASVSQGVGSVAQQVGGASGVATAFAAQTSQLANGLGQLLAGSTALQSGIAKLSAGNAQLASGIAKLDTGGGQLTSGLDKLRVGAGALEAGLGQLTSGSGQLASGLSAGVSPTGQLVSGLGQLSAGVTKFRGQLPSPKDLQQLQRQSPGLFDSGYFVLAAVEGAPAAARNQATFAVNLDRGGSAGQIVVISRYPSRDDRTLALADDLQASSAAFGHQTATETAVGGPGGDIASFNDEMTSRIVPVVLGVTVVIAIMMMVLLRTVLLPLVAAAFDLLVAAATFGILQLLFGGDDPVLGGPGYIDATGVVGVFAAIFGVTMIYEVILAERTREAFLASGDARAALREGLRHTAAVSTGAAAAMVAAAGPALLSGLSTVRQLGLGVAIVAVLNALVLRPVLLPAATELLGRAGWWPTSRSAPPTPQRTTPTPPAPAPPAGRAPIPSGS
jgi:X-X-X-Leu-X-X-Gly heptad repeat protein